MATLGKIGDFYVACFRSRGIEDKKSLKTTSLTDARAAMHSIEQTLHRLFTGMVPIPEGVDSSRFILGGGILTQTARRKADVCTVAALSTTISPVKPTSPCPTSEGKPSTSGTSAGRSADAKGRWSIFPEYWGKALSLRPWLRDSGTVWCSARILRSLAGVDGGNDEPVRPIHRVVPRLASQLPSFEDLRALRPAPTFASTPGDVLMVGRFTDLRLPGPAQDCQQVGGQSRLGGLSYGVVDPIEWLAGRP